MFAGSPDMASSTGGFSHACEKTFFGNGDGRCDDTYWNAGLQLIGQNCNGPNGLAFFVQGGHLQGAFTDTCSPTCRSIFEPVRRTSESVSLLSLSLARAAACLCG